MDQTASNQANPLDAEDLAYFGFAGDNLFELRLKHADNGGFDIVDDFVDDLVGTDLDAFLICGGADTAIRSDVEGNDCCASGLSECHIARSRWANGLVQKVDLDFGSL